MKLNCTYLRVFIYLNVFGSNQKYYKINSQCTVSQLKLLSVSDKFLPLHLQERSLNQKGQLRSIVEGFAMRAERPDSRRMGVELAGDGPTASAIVTQANIHSMHSPDIEDLAGGLLVTISITSRDRTRAC